MKNRSVAHILPAEPLDMEGTTVHQSLPTQRVEQIDPFLLLHHFGPFAVTDGGPSLDVAPHPHRGFEPVTFLYSGGLRHRDSRNNTGYLEGGDVQWMTAGMGIIHRERASKEFLTCGGVMEGIQLWVNLSPEHKMVQPRYQDVKSADIPTVAPSEGAALRVVAGRFGETQGPVKTYSPVNAWQLTLRAESSVDLPVPKDHNLAIYLLDGQIQLNRNFNYRGRTLLHFRPDGDGLQLKGVAEETRILVLSGKPLGAPVTRYGPFVMNSQTEIMEAMRDYQMGKMGFYIEE